MLSQWETFKILSNRNTDGVFLESKNRITSLRKEQQIPIIITFDCQKVFGKFLLMTIMNFCDALTLQRTRIVQVILTSKKVVVLFSRDLQYLAIAIIDKFLSVLSKTESFPYRQISESYIPISALIIAHKFGKNDSSGLKKILGLLKKGSQNEEEYEAKKIVKTEEQILKAINFQIPQTTCYVELQNFINSRASQLSKNSFLIKTAMKLLKQISLLSSEVSNYPEVGKQVYELVERKEWTERSKRLYKLVIFSMRQKDQQTYKNQG